MKSGLETLLCRYCGGKVGRASPGAVAALPCSQCGLENHYANGRHVRLVTTANGVEVHELRKFG